MSTDVDLDIVKLYRPPQEDCDEGRCNGGLGLFQLDFILCIIVPAAVILLMLIVLTVLLCKTSKTCKCGKKTVANTSNEMEMETYDCVRRASYNLRRMSHNREIPLAAGGRDRAMTMDHSYRRHRRGRSAIHSAPSTLQRHYRNQLPHRDEKLDPPPPPAYSMYSDDVFLGPEDMQVSFHSESNANNNDNSAQPLLNFNR